MSFSVRSRKISDKTEENDPFIVNEEEIMNEKVDKKGVVYREEPEWLTSLYDKLRVGVLTTLSYYLRTMKLGFPRYVTELELELTSQVNWYMSGKFFIGKFPPLVGIVSSSIARVVGYYGTEDLYYAGQPFVEFPLVALRRVSAILGASLIPLSYFTMRHLGHSRSTATMAAALIMMENGLVTQSRYATPEIYVLFFSALATWSWTSIHKYNQESNTILNTKSGLWQLFTGVSLGCALSSKWTGALSMVITWTCIGFEIWNRLCERRAKVKNTLKRLAVYSFTVGLLPLFVYFAIFSFHLDLVPNAGDHDLLLSSQLKYSLQGNELEASQPNIAYGSQIVIRHDGTVGGYLHSHRKRFTGGSTQQEVTLYPYVDINNIWTVHKANTLYNASDPLEFVKNKDQIRLEHFASTRKLHSHDHRPQMQTKKEHNEVTAYGDKMIQDSHDYWNLQILTEDNRASKDSNITWKALNQKFRLLHVRGCNLISHEMYYAPPAGDYHQEVTCMASAGTHISKWVVESSYHEKMEEVEHINYAKMTKVEMLKEVHQSMMMYPKIMYSRLQTSATNDGALNLRKTGEESPNKWFFKRSALKFWNELSGFSTHLVLNPIVQRLTLFSMSTYLGFLALNAFLWKRQIKLPRYLMWLNTTGLDVIVNEYYTRSVTLFYSAILVHLSFLRFFPAHTTNMSDILGSMYYGTGLIAVLLEACTTRLPTLWRRTIFYGLLVLALYKFSGLSHLAYGGQMWYRSDCEASGLDMDCIRFPPHQHELADMILNSGRTTNSTQLTIYVDLPGHSQAFRYEQGQEVEADTHIAILKQSAYAKEVQSASGIYRYHRVLPTPGISPEESALWAREITDAAIVRFKAEREQKLLEEAKKQQEANRQVNEAAKKLQEEADQAAAAARGEEQISPEQVEAIQQAAEKLKQKQAIA